MRHGTAAFETHPARPPHLAGAGGRARRARRLPGQRSLLEEGRIGQRIERQRQQRRRRRRGAGRRRLQGRSAAAGGGGAVHDEGQHRPHRDQRVRRLRRAHRRQRRPRADRELGLLQDRRLQGQADGQRGRELGRPEPGQDRRLGHDRRRARGLRPAVPRGGAGADRLLARRRRPDRPRRHQEDQRPQGQAGRHLAVHRGRLLPPLSRAGSRPVGQRR